MSLKMSQPTSCANVPQKVFVLPEAYPSILPPNLLQIVQPVLDRNAFFSNDHDSVLDSLPTFNRCLDVIVLRSAPGEA